MDKIPFAENLQECLPKEYGKNLAEMNETQLLAMYEDNRRWRECEDAYKAFKESASRKQAAESIGNWLRSLTPFKYQEDMRRRMNHLREKYKGA